MPSTASLPTRQRNRRLPPSVLPLKQEVGQLSASLLAVALDSQHIVDGVVIVRQPHKIFHNGNLTRLKGFGEQLAIVYDEKLVSAPNLKEEISGGECWISGNFTTESAEQLASTLRIGALPLELENIHDNVVGATLGSQALKTSLFAGD